MNRNKPEKLARIELRVKPKDKERIVKTAKQCGLSTSEYVLQRALGYTPKTVNPDAFYHFYGKLCELLNKELTPELQKAALTLFDEIYAELIDNSKQPIDEIRKEVLLGSPQSLLCGEKEHPRSIEPFGTCDESDERRCDTTWQQPDSGPSKVGSKK